MAEAYIVAAARTAGGRKGGRLAGWHPADLAAEVLDALIERSGADPKQVEDVVMGCVSQAGEQSTNIGRNAVLASKLGEGTSVTVRASSPGTRGCASGGSTSDDPTTTTKPTCSNCSRIAPMPAKLSSTRARWLN